MDGKLQEGEGGRCFSAHISGSLYSSDRHKHLLPWRFVPSSRSAETGYDDDAQGV